MAPCNKNADMAAALDFWTDPSRYNKSEAGQIAPFLNNWRPRQDTS